MELPDLDDYMSYPPTRSCYLDGRYFNMALAEYPGLIRQPLRISLYPAEAEGGMGGEMEGEVGREGGERTVQRGGERLRVAVHMPEARIDRTRVGLLRVLFETPNNRHVSLLLLDYAGKRAYWFDPGLAPGTVLRRFVRNNIQQYLNLYLDIDVVEVEAEVPDVSAANPRCHRSGFCGAYVLKYAYDYLLGREFCPEGILSFAAAVEAAFGPLDGEPEAEYGFLDDPGARWALIGGLGGALAGSLLTRGSFTGALVGGALGGLGGYFLGSGQR